MAASSRTSWFIRLDLPTFGRPTSTTVSPSDRRTPVFARARIDASRSSIAATFPAASAARRKSMSSSGKSSVASVYMRSVVTSSTSACTSRENTPDSDFARCARSRRRRRFDQVGDAFRLREIELAVEERALRELPGLGEARAKLEAPREQQSQADRAAVTVQLEHRFAGVRGRRGEVQREPLVERLALRAAECRERRDTGRKRSCRRCRERSRRVSHPRRV